MNRLASILTLILFVHTASAYNPIWVIIDKKIIKNIVQLDRNNPQAVEQYFRTQKIQKCNTDKENLGFGWKMWTPGIGGGYISISAKFIYYHDSIISYSLKPEMPEEKGLIKSYKNWYQNSFSFELGKIQSFYYHLDSIFRPLKEYNGTLTSNTVPRKILEYMTPNSSTMYGHSGGYPVNLLQNRRKFFEIRSSLTNDHVVFLMYSINPASRLTAIEYYLRHKDSFTNQQAIEEWIEKNFTETPKVETLFGCFREFWDTKTLVHMNSFLEMDE
jgi:hypothetical protein